MKKYLLIAFVAMTLTACGRGRQEQLNLEQALLEKMQADTDLKDYKIDPKDMTDCVVAEISQSLPVLPMDPQRGAFFQAYATFITASNPLKAIDDATPLFGSKQEARKAAMSITEHVMSCMSRLLAPNTPEEEPESATPPKAKPTQKDKPAT